MYRTTLVLEKEALKGRKIIVGHNYVFIAPFEAEFSDKMNILQRNGKGVVPRYSGRITSQEYVNGDKKGERHTRIRCTITGKRGKQR